ncbi:hypothetical protein [Flavobacterium sp.]|jgi:peptidoglycan/LPS O-acetylase OafA/YrhL|uniref:hypothetical protein n=1 Tax=Flavobacterium sp. TaxID=239 RepID=UPI00262BC750|nr:hypothetical protein [Flavobacterium sp.]
MAQSPTALPSLHFPTFAFVLLCWSFPLGILSVSVGPIYWVCYGTQYYAWSPLLFYTFQTLLLSFLIGFLLLLSQRTTLVLINPIEGLLQRALWILLTLLFIVALGGLILEPELLLRMQHNLTFPNR